MRYEFSLKHKWAQWTTADYNNTRAAIFIHLKLEWRNFQFQMTKI